LTSVDTNANHTYGQFYTSYFTKS